MYPSPHDKRRKTTNVKLNRLAAKEVSRRCALFEPEALGQFLTGPSPEKFKAHGEIDPETIAKIKTLIEDMEYYETAKESMD